MLLFNYFRLIRFPNLIIMGLTQVFLVFYTIPISTDRFSLENFFLPLSWVLLVAGAGYVINDFYDQEIDQINKPEKRLIGTKITEFQALIFYFGLCSVAFGLMFIPLQVPELRFFPIFYSLILWLYARYFKKIPFFGNLTVAFCTASAIGILIISYAQIYSKIAFFSFFAFLTNLVREIIKDLEDYEGDRQGGCETLPIVLGIPNTKRITVFWIGILGIALIFSGLFFSEWQLSPNLFLGYIILTEISLVWSIYKLNQARVSQDYHQISSYYKILMISGIFSVALF